MDVNLVGFCQGSGGEIDIESAESDHREDVVTRHDVRGFPKELAQPDSGVGGDFREHLLLGFGLDRRVGPDVVLQELNIPLVHPVDLSGRADAIVETKFLGAPLARRTVPLTAFGGAIPIRAPFCEAQEFLFGFPFLPTGSGPPNDEEVGCMENAQALSARSFVVQLYLNGLIVKLENFGIVLHFVYARKFDTMTLELDGDAHLPAGVTTADVRPATTYPAGRIRCTNSINQRSAVE
jgi:hypothetical protein